MNRRLRVLFVGGLFNSPIGYRRTGEFGVHAKSGAS
jgi:hypothetical protein